MHVRSPLPSLIDASSNHRQELFRLTQVERDWYADYPKFATNADIVNEAHRIRSRLKFINPDENVVPIGRLRNPELRESFPPYLLKESAVVLKAFGKAWRREAIRLGVNRPQIRLAVTSLSRSTEMQDRIVSDPAKLAVPGSTHTVGASFDIDASGYYMYDHKSLMVVTHPDRDKFKEAVISGRLRGMTSDPYLTKHRPDLYDPTVVEALLNVTERMHDAGLINSVVEYSGTENQCVHIAPNPTELQAVKSFAA